MFGHPKGCIINVREKQKCLLPYYQATRVDLPEHPVVSEAIEDYLADENKGSNIKYWNNTFNELFPATRELILAQIQQKLDRKDYLGRIKDEKKLLEQYPLHKEIK